jgi:two-component system, OmpR family, sensor kinase
MPGWRQGLAAGTRRALRWARSSRWDIVWAAFVLLNLVVMRLDPEWGTVPFLCIWVSLTVIYGFRLWKLQSAILTLAVVTIATGGIIGIQVIRGQQDADYLVEVPLIALMFLVMVWHGRRRLAALDERLVALDEVQRVSQENLRLLEKQRMFLLDAAHELGTPITVALGHAELIQQAATDGTIADDTRVVVGELARLRRLAGRLLLLTSADSPGFLNRSLVGVDTVVMEALDRWGYTPRRWRLGEVAEGTVVADHERLAVAMDALLENAIAHTEKDDLIELSARMENGQAVLTVTDSGCGIAEEDLDRIFSRFSRATPYRSRETGGFGLGLPVVAAIAEAHHGSVRVSSKLGGGATFELLLPAAAETADGAEPPAVRSGKISLRGDRLEVLTGGDRGVDVGFGRLRDLADRFFRAGVADRDPRRRAGAHRRAADEQPAATNGHCRRPRPARP